jgi:hypothetical protein
MKTNKSFFELLTAKQYYKHKWAKGWIVLHNGHCAFHGTKKEAIEFLRGRDYK